MDPSWEEHGWITLPLVELEGDVIQKLVRDRKRLDLAIARLEIMAHEQPSARGLFLLARLLTLLQQYADLQGVMKLLIERFPESPEEAFAQGFLMESLAWSVKGKDERERLAYEAYAAYRDAMERAPDDPYSWDAFSSFMRRYQARAVGPPKLTGERCAFTTYDELEERRKRQQPTGS